MLGNNPNGNLNTNSNGFFLLPQIIAVSRRGQSNRPVMGNVRAGVGVAAVLLWAAVGVQGHGRLIEPPSRSSAWR